MAAVGGVSPCPATSLWSHPEVSTWIVFFRNACLLCGAREEARGPVRRMLRNLARDDGLDKEVSSGGGEKCSEPSSIIKAEQLEFSDGKGCGVWKLERSKQRHQGFWPKQLGKSGTIYWGGKFWREAGLRVAMVSLRCLLDSWWRHGEGSGINKSEVLGWGQLGHINLGVINVSFESHRTRSQVGMLFSVC